MADDKTAAAKPAEPAAATTAPAEGVKAEASKAEDSKATASAEASSSTAAAPAPAPAAAPEEGDGGAAFQTLLPPSHWQQPENVTHDDDADSALGDDAASSTASITSTILHYREIHGRTFHNNDKTDGDYWGANDNKNSEALDMVHHMITLSLGGKTFLAPLDTDKLNKVLDIGTGTGIWAIDFADEYPNVEVIGTDLSPIQPDFVPPNLQFEIDDCTLPWTFSPNTFDYVHIRWLVGSIVDWNNLFKEAYDALAPGGWIESHETDCTFDSDDNTVHEKTALGQWSKIFVAGGKKSGRSFSVVHDNVQQTAMEAAGFTNISSKHYKTHVGEWPTDHNDKQIGLFAAMSVLTDAEGFLLYTLSQAGWTEPEILVYAAQLRRELKDKKVHSFFKQKVVWGQKPLDAA